MQYQAGLGSQLKQFTVYTYGAPVVVWATSEENAMSQVKGARSAEQLKGMGRRCL